MREASVAVLFCVGVLSVFAWGCSSNSPQASGGAGGGVGGGPVTGTRSTHGPASSSSGSSQSGEGGADGGPQGFDGSTEGGTVATGFSVGGTVRGLLGTGLALREGTLYFPMAITADGPFTFANRVAPGSALTVTVQTQPTNPTQNCTVLGGTLTAVTADVTNISVVCGTTPYFIGGHVTGLASGNSVVLVDNNDTANAVTVNADGTFKFPAKIESGTSYSVTIGTQPNGTTPQTCTVSAGAGTVGAADVSSVVVNCDNQAFAVGGTVTGLLGTGLVLENNLSDDVSVSSATFAFATPVRSGQAYSVTVKTQPTSPTQACTVSSATGTVAASPIGNVLVTCTSTSFSVGGTIRGLQGSGLTLQDNGGDTLPISAGTTKFAFATSVASGAPYAVTVLSQPKTPAQTCEVSQTGTTVENGPVTDIAVSCSTNTYAVGGTVSGMTGTGLVLANNAGTGGGGDQVPINSDGSFSFPTPVGSGDPYHVTVLTQPTGGTSGETCHVSAGVGTVGNGPATSVVVACASGWATVGGALNNLLGGNLSLSLSAPALDGGTPTLLSTITVSGSAYAFPITVADGNGYQVAIVSQPTSPTQVCVLSGAAGVASGSAVPSVDVTCTTQAFPVIVNVSGLAPVGDAGTGGVTLENNGGDPLVIQTDGAYPFATSVFSGQPYSVTIPAGGQPTTPMQQCTVTNGGGTMGAQAVNNVTVTCTTDTYAISGNITNLNGTLTLQNVTTDGKGTVLGTESLPLTPTAQFAFKNQVPWGAGFAVSVLTQPSAPSQTCVIAPGTSSGTAPTNVGGVAVSCTTNSFPLEVNVTGLPASLSAPLVIQNNGGASSGVPGGQNLTITGNGQFSFATPLLSETTYDVTIFSTPTGLGCSVGGATGTVVNGAVTSVNINCGPLKNIGGTISGLTGSGLQLKNGSDTLTLNAGATSFQFPTQIPTGGTYAITVATQPSAGVWETCTMAAGTSSGTVGTSNVSVALTCAPNLYNVNVNVTGLLAATGKSLGLLNSTSDALTVTTAGTSAFAVKVASGKQYSVVVQTQPTSPAQTCVVQTGSGTIQGADVTIPVTCTANKYSVGGTVMGYLGSGLALTNNGTDKLPITALGPFSFLTQIASGNAYAVAIGTQAAAPSICSVTANGAGTVGNGPVTNVAVSCGFGYTFDASSSTSAWQTSNAPTASTLGWASTVDSGQSPTSGSLLATLPFAAANTGTKIFIVPPSQLNATGMTLTAYVRVDAPPTTDGGGAIELYAADSAGSTPSLPYHPMNTFYAGTWTKLTYVLPASGNWSTVSSLGILVIPGTAGFQTAKIYIDSITLQ